MSEVEETLKRINSHKGVVGIVIANHEGAPIRSTLETAVAEQMSSQLLGLAAKARSAVRNLDPQNDLTFLRIRSKKHEILVAPEKVRFALHMRVAMSSSRASSSSNRRRKQLVVWLWLWLLVALRLLLSVRHTFASRFVCACVSLSTLAGVYAHCCAEPECGAVIT